MQRWMDYRLKNYLTNNRKYDNIDITEKDRQWEEANKGMGGKISVWCLCIWWKWKWDFKTK